MKWNLLQLIRRKLKADKHIKDTHKIVLIKIVSCKGNCPQIRVDEQICITDNAPNIQGVCTSRCNPGRN